MSCYHPLTGYRSRQKNEYGNYFVVFNPKYGYRDLEIILPCGNCIGCRLRYARDWAIRSHCESQLHEQNCFLTLTFNQENIPKDNSIKVDDIQKFIKRLRKRIDLQIQKEIKNYPYSERSFYLKKLREKRKIKYLSCGEYGLKNKRPHYHILVFNFDFPDKEIFKNKLGNNLYRSKMLEQLWPYGFSTIGEVSFNSASYVARYMLKKQKGENSKDHYSTYDSLGEIYEISKEFSTSSKRPPIGYDWFKLYQGDVYPKDFLTIGGKIFFPPKYFDNLLKENDIDAYNKLKAEREIRFRNNDNSFERLSVKEELKNIQSQRLIREIEDELI